MPIIVSNCYSKNSIFVGHFNAQLETVIWNNEMWISSFLNEIYLWTDHWIKTRGKRHKFSWFLFNVCSSVIVDLCQSKMKLGLLISLCVQVCLINCYIIEPGPVVIATKGIHETKTNVNFKFSKSGPIQLLLKHGMH